jgi:bifunctional DNA primase/polymerase-like protein
VTDLSPQQTEALQVAHVLADAGMPIFAMFRDSGSGEFLMRDQWQLTKPGEVSHNWINRWRPGMALCGVTGVTFDVIDIDPRNGGRDGFIELEEAIPRSPRVYAIAETPSQGEHIFIGRTGLAKTSKAGKGVDLQAGDNYGEGRGFVYLAPTERVSKYGPHKGETVAYHWTTVPGGLERLGQEDPGLVALAEYVRGRRGGKRTVTVDLAAKGSPVTPDDADAFADYASDWSEAEAVKMVRQQC